MGLDQLSLQRSRELGRLVQSSAAERRLVGAYLIQGLSCLRPVFHLLDFRTELVGS
jgi:hypothetical protein